MKITEAFSLDDDRDADIVAWLKQQLGGAKSRAIREAIRLQMSDGLTLADIHRGIVELRELIEGGEENVQTKSDIT